MKIVRKNFNSIVYMLAIILCFLLFKESSHRYANMTSGGETMTNTIL